jgi:predicted PurR-regulated permease PerM
LPPERDVEQPGQEHVSGAREDARGIVSTPAVSKVVRWGLVAWSLIGLGLAGYLGYKYLLSPIRIVFPPLLVAMIVVYLLNPLVSRLQARGLPRVWGTLLTYVVFFSVVGVVLRYLLPVLARQVSSFAASVPDLLNRAEEAFARIVERLDLNVNVAQLFASLGPDGGAGEFISRLFGFTVGVLHALLIFLLGAVLAFYLLVDLPKIQRGASALIPARRRPEVSMVTTSMGKALGGFFRGQLLVALFVGLASMLGLYIVGLPYWALVGAVAGLFNLIPLVGPFIGAVPALFIAFTTETTEGLLHLAPGWPMAIGASVALTVVQQIDNHIISPNVVARTVRVHPVTVMLGLLVGGTLLGLWGMLLAVPTIASAKILVLHMWDTRLQWPPRPREEAGGPSPAADGLVQEQGEQVGDDQPEVRGQPQAEQGQVEARRQPTPTPGRLG